MLQLLSFLFTLVLICRSEDIIVPGAPPNNVSMQAGYFDINEFIHLHYVFVKSKNDPLNDPLIVWVNGASGCSGLRFLFTMFGPFIINDDGQTLTENPSSWSRISNLLIIDSPIGAGFSFNDNNVTIRNVPEAIEIIYKSIQQFYVVHPEFKNNNIYLASSGSGGMFIPFLTEYMLDKGNYENLGIILGNAYFYSDTEIYTRMEYMYGHGIIDQEFYKTFQEVCCGGAMYQCGVFIPAEENLPYCSQLPLRLGKEVWTTGINMFNILEKCEQDSKIQLNAIEHFSNIIELENNSADINSLPCIDEGPLTKYLNSEAFRTAFSVSSKASEWRTCKRVYLPDILKLDVPRALLKALNTNSQILLFGGDADLVTNFLVVEKLVHSLGLNKTAIKEPYFISNKVAGYVTSYENLELITVLGGGHMAKNKKDVVLDILDVFLN